MERIFIVSTGGLGNSGTVKTVKDHAETAVSPVY